MKESLIVVPWLGPAQQAFLDRAVEIWIAGGWSMWAIAFVAISASAAPLLGLLGTVTGIMNTFNMITIYGTGDVKSLSSGISEALITTEYGLIVAIPCLLMHAFLSAQARGIVGRMEATGLSFMNELLKSEVRAKSAPKAEPVGAA